MYVSLKIHPNFSKKDKIVAEKKIDAITEELRTTSQTDLNILLQLMIPYLDRKRLRNSHFLVMDVEFVNVNYPTKRIHKNIRSFKFPCIFTTVLWNGTTKNAEIITNVFTLPCHFCKENCREFRNHSIKFRCLYFANSFISTQTDFFEKLLAENESLKIFSYGKGDFKQLEHSDNFFIHSFNSRIYYRKNRKKPLRIVKIAQDVSIPDIGLNEIEEDILKKWIIGWSRQRPHTNVNRKITTHISKKDFSEKYHIAIETCISDSISTFLYLLYRDYRLNDKPISLDFRI